MDIANHQNSNMNQAGATPEKDKPIPFDSAPAKPIEVNRQPLTLGGAQGSGPRSAGASNTPAPVRTQSMPTAQAPAQAAPSPRPVVATKPLDKAGSADRVSGMKTFFAKLHPGSMTFLEEQIHGWLKENPAVTIKTTNVTVGDVIGKTTEANLIIVVWY